jgi:GntR family transcriptional regulator
VRKAIDELAAENLVVRRQGKGTFVATHAEQHVQYRFLKLVPDTGDLDSEGPAQRNIVDCRRTRASADVARALGPAHRAMRCCRPAGCCRSGRPDHSGGHLAAGRPLQGPDAERSAEYHGPTYAMFETEFGVRMVRAAEKIRAVAPMAQATCFTFRGTPLAERRTRRLHLQRHPHGTAPRPVPHRHHHYRNELN